MVRVPTPPLAQPPPAPEDEEMFTEYAAAPQELPEYPEYCKVGDVVYDTEAVSILEPAIGPLRQSDIDELRDKTITLVESEVLSKAMGGNAAGAAPLPLSGL